MLVLIASQFIRADVPPEYDLIPLLMIPLNLGLFFLGIWAVDKGHLPAWVNKPLQAVASWLKITTGQVFSLFFSLIFSILTCVAAGFLALMYSPQTAVICWGTGIILAAFGGMDLFITRQKVSRSAILVGLVLFAVALLLRGFNTTTIPAVLSGDEASSGLYSLNFLNGNVNNIFISGWFSFPSFHNFLQSVFIAIFGQTTQALRFLAVLAGALTVALVFYVGRSMYGFITGLMAAIFLTGMHFANHFSRIGLNNIWDGVFFTLVMGFLWVGWQRDKRAAYLVAGLGLGLAQYFYTTGRVLFIVIPLWLLVAGLTDHARFRRAIPNLVLMLWATLIVLLPLAWFYLHYPNEFFAPMTRVGIFSNDWMAVTVQQTGHSPALVVLSQIWKGMLGYVSLPLNAWYTPGVPVLRTLPGIVFLLGIPFLFLHPKDSRNHLLFLWLAGFALAVGFSESTPASQRYVAATPAVALMIGFSMKELGDLFGRLFSNRTRVIQTILVVIVFLLAADDARFYYLDYSKDSNFAGFNGLVAQKLANRLQREPAGVDLVFDGYPDMGYDSIASLPYLAPKVHYYNVNDAWGSADTPVPADRRIFFAFLPDHDDDRKAVESAYPGGVWNEEYTSTGDPLYWLYEYNRP
jgi:4-amino-4-deoxy-L-arabinose transferase-like glycosyltransferase